MIISPQSLSWTQTALPRPTAIAKNAPQTPENRPVQPAQGGLARVPQSRAAEVPTAVLVREPAGFATQGQKAVSAYQATATQTEREVLDELLGLDAWA